MSLSRSPDLATRMALHGGVEPPEPGLEDLVPFPWMKHIARPRRSLYFGQGEGVVRIGRIELPSLAWQAGIFPLDHIRMFVGGPEGFRSPASALTGWCDSISPRDHSAFCTVIERRIMGKTSTPGALYPDWMVVEGRIELPTSSVS